MRKNGLDAAVLKDWGDFTLCLIFTVTRHVMDTYSLIKSNGVGFPCDLVWNQMWKSR